MQDSRVQEDRDYVSSGYAESAVSAQQVFVPNSHMRVMDNNQKAEVIRETYRLLAIGVFAAMAAAWLACRCLPVVQFMTTTPGLILGMLGLNMIPGMAMSAARKSPSNAALLLAGQGTLAGICVSPLVLYAMMLSGVGANAPNLVQSALVITAAVFLGISGYIYQSGTNFTYLKGFGAGLTWTLFAACAISWVSPLSGGFALAFLIGMGILGTLQLLWATSSVLRDPDFREPVYGALCLFAGLFNLFQVILHLLIRSRR